jgi:hypothetical protein
VTTTADRFIRCRIPRGSAARWFGAIVAVAAMVGCATDKKGAKAPVKSSGKAVAVQSEPISNTDPCAMRMHDISGGFLLYYAKNQRLPQSLDELRELPGMEALPAMACPVSNKPYLYTPNGILMPERDARIILADPAPSHSRMRWVISVGEPKPNQPLLMRVVAMPESFFLLRPPQ